VVERKMEGWEIGIEKMGYLYCGCTNNDLFGSYAQTMSCDNYVQPKGLVTPLLGVCGIIILTLGELFNT
jgi:hypothetical protein